MALIGVFASIRKKVITFISIKKMTHFVLLGLRRWTQVETVHQINKQKAPDQGSFSRCQFGAGEGTLTPGLVLGKDAL